MLDTESRMTIEQMNEILNDLADEIPLELFNDLNGGVALSPETVHSPYAMNNDLYILGRYHRGGFQGRYIMIYYGSVMNVYGMHSDERIKDELRKILRHEFRHHVESLAGEKDLEIEDAEFIGEYLSNHMPDVKDEEFSKKIDKRRDRKKDKSK